MNIAVSIPLKPDEITREASHILHRSSPLNGLIKEEV